MGYIKSLSLIQVKESAGFEPPSWIHSVKSQSQTGEGGARGPRGPVDSQSQATGHSVGWFQITGFESQGQILKEHVHVPAAIDQD
jgi:hypothetical protein